MLVYYLLKLPYFSPKPQVKPVTRTDIINALIKRYNYKSYLEIGVENPFNNFNHINTEHKVGIDPEPRAQATLTMTSDDFFETNSAIDPPSKAKWTFDIIFIDGLHLYEQVLKDVENSLKILNRGGTIVVDDCNPPEKKCQTIPREQLMWTGDVWKAFAKLRATREDLFMLVVDIIYGVGIVQRGSQETISLPPHLTSSLLDYNRDYILNLKSPETYLDHLPKERPKNA